MNCLDVHRAALQNPEALDPAVLDHARHCPDCAAFLQRQRHFNDALRSTLRVDAPAHLADRIIFAQTAQTASHRPLRHSIRRYVALAASLMLVTLSIAFIVTPAPSLAREIARHVDEERLRDDVIDTSPRADLADRARFFDVSVIRPLPVSRTSICLIGHWLALHFVLDGSGGPVEVVVVPGASIKEKTAIEAGALHGTLVPENGYALAVLNSVGMPSDSDVHDVQKALVLPNASLGPVRSAIKSITTWAHFVVLAVEYGIQN